jgi:hypothetical protein
MIFTPFYVRCGNCNHRNRPHPSPAEGIKLALLGQLPACKRCGKPLTVRLPERPLVKRVRAELTAQRLLPAPGNS